MLMNLIPTLVGGFLAILGGFIQQSYLNKKNQKNKTYEEKKAIVKDILANKYILANNINSSADADAKNKFISALNLIPFVFQDNASVKVKYNNFIQSLYSKENTNDTLYELISELFQDLNLPAPTKEDFIQALYI